MRFTVMAKAGVLLAGMLQMPSAPPMRTGLWEQSSSMTLTMPGAKTTARPPVVTKTQSCVTAAGWSKEFGNTGRAGSCVRSHEMFTDRRLSFDLTCPNQNATGHGEMRFTGDTGKGTVHLEIHVAGHSVMSETRVTSRFVNASCGALAAGSTRVIP